MKGKENSLFWLREDEGKVGRRVALIGQVVIMTGGIIPLIAMAVYQAFPIFQELSWAHRMYRFI